MAFRIERSKILAQGRRAERSDVVLVVGLTRDHGGAGRDGVKERGGDRRIACLPSGEFEAHRAVFIIHQSMDLGHRPSLERPIQGSAGPLFLARSPS